MTIGAATYAHDLGLGVSTRPGCLRRAAEQQGRTGEPAPVAPARPPRRA